MFIINRFNRHGCDYLGNRYARVDNDYITMILLATPTDFVAPTEYDTTTVDNRHAPTVCVLCERKACVAKCATASIAGQILMMSYYNM